MKKPLLIVLVVLAGLVLLAALAAAVAWSRLQSWAERPLSGKGLELGVEIPAGVGPKTVSAILQKAGVIDDAGKFAFYLHYVKRASGKIKAGELAFRDNLSPQQVLGVLIDGTPMTYSITFPEGLRADEIAALLEKAHLIDDAREFMRLVRDERFANSLGVAGPGLEGYLFPDTYRLRRSMPAAEAARAMVERFRAVFTPEWQRRAEEIGFGERRAVTLASIVEKETGAPEERALIAGVFHNRLRDGWKLQTDPSVIYAVILARGSFNGNLTRADLQLDHPYNTYRYPGLPPGPICNPGKEALRAALWPEKTKHYFFVSRNDGTHEFCPDLKCHNRAVARWQLGGGK